MIPCVPLHGAETVPTAAMQLRGSKKPPVSYMSETSQCVSNCICKEHWHASVCVCVFYLSPFISSLV